MIKAGLFIPSNYILNQLFKLQFHVDSMVDSTFSNGLGRILLARISMDFSALCCI